MSTVRYFEAPIDDLRPNPFNPNMVSAENEEKIRESIRRNGIFKPIIVREVSGKTGYEIIGGQHRWEQAKALEMATVPVANLGEIDEIKAKEIGLLDNARYGVDDTMALSSILQEIGNTEELQLFLPYADTDLSAIFSASNIDLDDLDVTVESDIPEENPEVEAPVTKAPKTHTVMRFKVTLADAEAITQAVSQTRRDHDFNHEDDLTNAGDALVHLLHHAGALTGTAPSQDLDELLNEIEGERE